MRKNLNPPPCDGNCLLSPEEAAAAACRAGIRTAVTIRRAWDGTCVVRCISFAPGAREWVERLIGAKKAAEEDGTMNGKGIETFAICAACRGAFRGDEVRMVPSRRGDGWMAIRCDDCGGYQAAKKAEQRRESRVRARKVA